MPDPDLLGTMWSRADAGTCRFHCPRCDTERGCRLRTLQRRLAVLGRPIVRIGGRRSFRTCEHCGHAFADDDTAPRPPGVPAAEADRALLAVVAAVVFSDSVVRPSEKEAAEVVLRRYVPDLGETDADDLLRGARRRWGDPIARLERLRGLVDEGIRRRILEAAYYVCTADGEVHREESRLLDRIGEALDLPFDAMRRALSTARDRPLD